MLKLPIFPLLVICLSFTCLACSRAQPINPATGQPLSINSSNMSHAEKVALQEEVMKRQQLEQRRQNRELLEVQRQDHYNLLSERYKGN